MPKEEYNQNIKEEFGLEENDSTEKSAGELNNIIATMIETNMRKSGWFSVNGKSDLIDMATYYMSTAMSMQKNPEKKYKVEYSKVNKYIRSFTIDELEYTYPGSGIIPTDTEFGIPFCTQKAWNIMVNGNIPQSPAEVSGEDVKAVLSNFYLMNVILTENHPTWGLTVNGKMLPSDINSIADSIKETAKYKVEYKMDNGYIRHLTVEEITASTPTPVPSETEQEETPSNPTESTTDTSNQETNKQHILDDEPKTGL